VVNDTETQKRPSNQTVRDSIGTLVFCQDKKFLPDTQERRKPLFSKE
jgi:hypothetical protein